MRVYIIAPLTNGNTAVNIRAVVFAAEKLIEAGHTPFVPHLNHMWELIAPHPARYWLDWDLKWLKVCDAAVRLPNVSVGRDGLPMAVECPGGDEEQAVAERVHIPVFHSVGEFLKEV